MAVLAYYIFLGWKNRRSPGFSVHHFNRQVRTEWVNRIIMNGKMEILAVQTLRNSVMAANFMASTSILLIIGTLNLSEKIEKWAYAWHPLGTGDHMPPELWLFKLGMLLLDFFIAFYCFSMAIRFFNHVGYMINLPAVSTPSSISEHQICAYLNRAGSYYTFGTRCFFFSLPLILWFFGPYALALGALALIFALYQLDRAP